MELKTAEQKIQKLTAERDELVEHRHALVKEIDKINAERERLVKGLKAVENLINDSYGVCGLHLNGDNAPWEELRTGGGFESGLGYLRDLPGSSGRRLCPVGLRGIDCTSSGSRCNRSCCDRDGICSRKRCCPGRVDEGSVCPSTVLGIGPRQARWPRQRPSRGMDAAEARPRRGESESDLPPGEDPC